MADGQENQGTSTLIERHNAMEIYIYARLVKLLVFFFGGEGMGFECLVLFVGPF